MKMMMMMIEKKEHSRRERDKNYLLRLLERVGKIKMRIKSD